MAKQTDKLAWYQNKVVSIATFISSIIFLCGLIVSIMWYGRMLNETREDVGWLKECQLKQIELNGKYNLIIEMRYEK